MRQKTNQFQFLVHTKSNSRTYKLASDTTQPRAYEYLCVCVCLIVRNRPGVIVCSCAFAGFFSGRAPRHDSLTHQQRTRTARPDTSTFAARFRYPRVCEFRVCFFSKRSVCVRVCVRTVYLHCVKYRLSKSRRRHQMRIKSMYPKEACKKHTHTHTIRASRKCLNLFSMSCE